MQACMFCTPRVDNPWSMEDVEEELYAVNIIYGIQYEKIEALVRKVNEEGQVVLGEKVAEGEAAVPGLATRLKYKVEVDLSLLGSFEPESSERPPNWVRQGDVIARVLSPVKGKYGLRVTGETLLLPEPEDEEVLAGENCHFDEDTMRFIADVDGEAALVDGGMLSVFPVQGDKTLDEGLAPVDEPGDSGVVKLSLEVAEDGMTALLTCQSGSSRNLLMEQVEELLYAKDVIHGIEYEKIASLIEHHNENGKGFESEIVAKGDPPINGADQVLSLYFDTELSPDQDQVIVGEKRYESNVVENSDIIACLSPYSPPRFGLTVMGKNIVGRAGRKYSVHLGRACSYSTQSGEIIACDSGMAAFIDGKIEVRPVSGVSIKSKKKKSKTSEQSTEVSQDLGGQLSESPEDSSAATSISDSELDHEFEDLSPEPHAGDSAQKRQKHTVRVSDEDQEGASVAPDSEFSEQDEIHDGVAVEVSEDEMEVTLTLRPRENQPWTLEELEDKIYKKDIVFGIEYETIQEVVEHVNSGKSVVREIIACGEPAVDGVDEKLTLFFSKDASLDLDNSSDPELLNPENHWDQCLKKGDIVAKFHSIIPPRPGLTVTGKKTEGREGRKSIYHMGEACIFQKDTGVYTSAIEGQVVLMGAGLLDVEPVRFIHGDVCLATGDIFFDGKVVVTGNVLSGLKVVAKSDVMVLGRIEIANITSGRNIFARGGIQGGNRGKKARLQVKGKLEAKFCNNAHVHCKGSITVNHSVLHCDIECSGFLKVLEGKGIVGGKIQAAEGIGTTCLGSPLGVPTEVFVGGYNYEIKTEISRIEGKRNQLSKKIKELSVRLKPYEGQNLGDLPKKIGEKMRGLRQELEMLLRQDRDHACTCDDLKSKLKSKREMIVTVTDTVYPDVRIQIGSSILQGLYEPIRKCIFQEHETHSAVEYYPILTDEEKVVMEIEVEGKKEDAFNLDISARSIGSSH